MTVRDDSEITPSRVEAGVMTAPTLSAADEISELRAEVERLKARLAGRTPVSDNESAWPTEITYGEFPYSSARLSGITKDRDAIRPTTDVTGLPEPTTDPAQLEADYIRWGYCIVKDSFSLEQVKAQTERLLDQAAAERAAGIAKMSHRGCAQTVFNLVPKGQAFRNLVALETSALQQAPLIESLVAKILGKSYYLGTAHGSIVHQRGGRQDLHQDQGYVPLPHSPYPLAVLIIHTYSDFSLEEGGTYLVPGSHRNAAGENRVQMDVEFEEIARGELLALTAPAGCSVLINWPV
jgi:hypothetical protein